MPSFTASAPGKIILFGEHAVVYGEPAIAAPIDTLQARAIVTPDINASAGQILVDAPDISLSANLDDLEDSHPLKAAIHQVLDDKGILDPPACRIKISSSIPPSSGLGSSAAVSTAIIRAFSAFLGQRLTNDQVSNLAFEVEKIHHGKPSGIDNTVVAYQKPIFYQKGDPFHFLEIPVPFTILIIYSGTPGNTFQAVQLVQQAWKENPDHYEALFHSIGEIAREARQAIESGSTSGLGSLMDENHQLLKKIGVSTPEIDFLANVAKNAGALGAKLSGGGLGGHLISLVEGPSGQLIEKLVESGAAGTQLTEIHPAVSLD
jgi:mevalonate kinase